MASNTVPFCPDWRPISTYDKRRRVDVLICTQMGYMYVVRWDGDGWLIDERPGELNEASITHWMPLPELPELPEVTE